MAGLEPAHKGVGDLLRIEAAGGDLGDRAGGAVLRDVSGHGNRRHWIKYELPAGTGAPKRVPGDAIGVPPTEREATRHRLRADFKAGGPNGARRFEWHDSDAVHRSNRLCENLALVRF